MHINREMLYQEGDWKERQRLHWTRMPNQVDSTPKKKKTEVWNKSIEKCGCLECMNNGVWL